MEHALGNEMELYWLFVYGFLCMDYSREAKWNDCVDCEMKGLNHLCCGVLRWVK